MQDWITSRRGALVCVVALLAIFVAQLAVTIVRDSSTWDESDHIYAGYESWTRADFGLNPEHPPLVKLVATAPMLAMRLNVPNPQDTFFMTAAFQGGKTLLYDSGNDAEAILASVRASAAIFAVLLALVIFLATREMFGVGAGLFALAFWVFDPLAIAHGARVTTDTAAAFGFFATTYAFYRYVKAPSWGRLALVGLAAGVLLGSKHTGIFIFPILALLAVTELLRGQTERREEPLGRQTARFAGALVVTGLVAVAVLWACYGFHYAARPDGLALIPPFPAQIAGLSAPERALLSTVASWHLLPESYLVGLAVVQLAGVGYHSYALGTIYPTRVMWYFPLAFTIKTTLGLLGMIALSVFAIATRRFGRAREVLFLTIPAVVFFLIALTGPNIGTRHIMPVYVYLTALAGGTAWALVRSNRKWAYVVGMLLLLHVGSSAFAFPNYMPYANEAWGGSSQTYRYLTDSSVDWAQQLKVVKKYCDEKGIKSGYFAYFGQGVIEPRYYDIPLEPLPTADSLWMDDHIQVPPSIDGPVFISAGVLSGFEFGPGKLDPYAQFRQLKPADVIDHSVFVYEGHFEIPLASALGHAQSAGALLEAKKRDEALAEAQTAVALAPDSVATQTALGDALAALDRKDEAHTAYARALELAKTVEPAFQGGAVPGLEKKLEGGTP